MYDKKIARQFANWRAIRQFSFTNSLVRSVRRQQDSAKLIRFVARLTCGEVSERFKEHAWKACVGEILPWVRIPPSPPFFLMARKKRGEAPKKNFLQRFST